MSYLRLTARAFRSLNQGAWSKSLYAQLRNLVDRVSRLETLVNSQIAPATAVLVAHDAADSRRITSPDAIDLASAITLANEIRTDYMAHYADTDVHQAADVTNTIAAVAATDLASLETLINEIKTDLVAHAADATTPHRAAQTITVTAADGSDLATSITLVNELKDDLNSHFAPALSRGVDTALAIDLLD